MLQQQNNPNAAFFVVPNLPVQPAVPDSIPRLSVCVYLSVRQKPWAIIAPKPSAIPSRGMCAPESMLVSARGPQGAPSTRNSYMH
jgi:hypothetical protein